MKDLVQVILLLIIIAVPIVTIVGIAQIVEEIMDKINLNRVTKDLERVKERNKDKNKETY